MTPPVALTRNHNGDLLIALSDGTTRRLAEVARGAKVVNGFEHGKQITGVTMTSDALAALLAFATLHANAPAACRLLGETDGAPEDFPPDVRAIADDLLELARSTLTTAPPAADALSARIERLADRVLDLPVVKPKDCDEGGLPDGRGFFNSARRVMFRAGILAGRELVARAIESATPRTVQLGVPYMTHQQAAASARETWPAELGDDPGAPRQLQWSEVAEGGGGDGPVTCKALPISVEALPIAWSFLLAKDAGVLDQPSTTETAVAASPSGA